jgi:hypothetical protein
MNKSFKMCWVSHDKVYVKDAENNTFTITMPDLLEILKNSSLKATKQITNYKLEAE